MKYPIYLASASPRRRMLLRGAGVPFEVCAANADETVPADWPPHKAVMNLAQRKAEAVASCTPAHTSSARTRWSPAADAFWASRPTRTMRPRCCGCCRPARIRCRPACA